MNAMPVPSLYAEEKTMQEELPKNATKTGRDRFLTLTVENDLFGSGSDSNYTSGVRLTYYDTSKRPSKPLHQFTNHFPFIASNETTNIYYSIGHNLYTPADITIKEHQPNDRPWAAFLYGSVGMFTLKDNHIDDVELTLGVVGPLAMGEGIQKNVHNVVNGRDPNGWGNQLENEPALMVSWRRRWPEAFKYDMDSLWLAVEPNIGTTIGNVYTFAETGVTAKLAPKKDRWQGMPILVRPSMPGSGFFQTKKELGWYLFGGAGTRAVARNIFLDGNTFTDSHSVDKKPIVFDANAGIAFTYGNVRLSYTAVYRTKEFKQQDDSSLFGAISLGYRY